MKQNYSFLSSLDINELQRRVSSGELSPAKISAQKISIGITFSNLLLRRIIESSFPDPLRPKRMITSERPRGILEEESRSFTVFNEYSMFSPLLAMWFRPNRMNDDPIWLRRSFESGVSSAVLTPLRFRM